MEESVSRENGKARRYFTPDVRAAILRRHMGDKVAVSESVRGMVKSRVLCGR